MAGTERPTSRKKSAIGRRLRSLLGLNRTIGLALLTALLALFAADPVPVEILRLKLFDLYQTIAPRDVADRPVTIVNVDERSLAEIGQWPWPRTLLADIVKRLFELGAAVVAFDIVFPENDRMNPATAAASYHGLDPETRQRLLKLPSNDQVFADALRGRPVVLGRVGYGEERSRTDNVPLRTTLVAKRVVDAPDAAAIVVRVPALIRNVPVIEAAGAGHGFISMLPEPDGIVRRVPMVLAHEGELYPSLSAEILRLAVGRPTLVADVDKGGLTGLNITRDLRIPTDGQGRVWPYFSHGDPIKYVSARDVLFGTVDAEAIRGKLIIIGSTAFGLHDIRATPIDRALPGVEVHAQVIENAVTGAFLRRPHYMIGAEMTLLLVGGMLMIWLVPAVGARWSLLLFAVLAGIGVGGTWYLFTEEHILFDVGYSLLAALVIYTFLTYAGYASEQSSRRRVREAFAHYLAPAMVEKLAEDPSHLRLGGETRPMSILFCDIRGFTTISETFKGDPGGLTALINKLLTPLTAIILDHGGTVDKYMGDCIMAFWNAPLDDPRHARNACLAALHMQAAMAPLNDRLSSEAAAEGRKHVPLAVGIGINSGEVVVGNMGSDQRFDYSVLGDDVNLASRLEGQSKAYGVGIVIGEKTHDAASELAMLELDLIRVKGKAEAARIFTLVGDETPRRANAFPVLEEAHDRLLQAYRRQDWPAAREHLVACRSLLDGFPLAGLYTMYEARLAEFEAEPPGPDWDGAYVATSK
jgi:adenylate cyclase